MLFNSGIRYAIAMAITFGLCSCLFDTAHETAQPDKSLAYTVKISNEVGGLRCSVFVEVRRWPSQDSLVFQLPAYYPDNPRMPVPGIQPSAIRIQNASGKLLSYAKASAPFSQGGGTWITVPANTRILSYAVDLDPNSPAAFGPPMPRIKTGVQLLDGSLLFILPANGTSLAAHWRNPIALTLNWQVDNGLPWMGNSAVNFGSNYQLMFVRGAVNPARSLEFQAGAHTVTLYSNQASDSLNLPALAVQFQRWIPLMEKHLGALPWQRLWIGTNSVHAGIEGIGGYWFRPEYAGNSEVHLHELTHSFVGILQGDLDDPWWKEAVTNYLGQIMAVEDGFYTDSAEGIYLEQAYDGVPSVMQYALSDPTLRDRFFHPLDSDYVDRPPQDYYTLLYNKGAQASMFIDAWLLKNSNGKHDLFEAVRMLYSSGKPGFSRAQLVAVLDSLSRQRSDTLLQSLCDKPGAFTKVRLQQGFADLKTYGRFNFTGANPALAKRTHGKPGAWREDLIKK